MDANAAAYTVNLKIDKELVYLLISNLTIFIYDWLLSASNEVAIVVKYGVTSSVAVYFFSRIFALCYAAGIPIVLSRTLNCSVFIAVVGVFFVLATSSTSFLLYLRVRTIYMKSTAVTALFGILWLASVALNIFVAATRRGFPVDIQPVYSGCVAFLPIKYAILPSMSAFVNDILIFLAISYRLTADAVTAERGWRARFLALGKGKGLYSLSRSLLQSGQVYFCVTILFFVILWILLLSPSIPGGFRYTLILIYPAFTNTLACSIFRAVALQNVASPIFGLTSSRIAAALRSNPQSGYPPTLFIQP